MENKWVHRHWRELLDEGHGPLRPKEVEKLWDPALSDEERGGLWGRFLASAQGRRLLLGEDDDPSRLTLERLLQAEQELKERVARNLTLREGQRDNWLERSWERLQEGFRRWAAPAPATPALADARTTSSLQVRLLTPRGKVPIFPYTFIWEGAPQAERYTFELIDDRFHCLHTSIQTATEVTYPSALPLPKAGSTMIWRVTAHGPRGNASGSARFFPSALPGRNG